MPTGAEVVLRNTARAPAWPSSWWWLTAKAPPSRVRPGRLDPHRVAVRHVHDRLVQRHPAGHPVAEPIGDQPGVVGERVRGLPGEPPALEHQLDRQIPVVQRHPGLDAGREQGVHQPVVEVQARGIGRPAAAGLHARPRGGEPVGPARRDRRAARGPRASGGSGRRRSSPSSRRRSDRGRRRTRPRSTATARPRRPRPRSGRRRWPPRTGSRAADRDGRCVMNAADLGTGAPGLRRRDRRRRPAAGSAARPSTARRNPSAARCRN